MISRRRRVIQSRTHNETVFGIIGDAVQNVSPPGSITCAGVARGPFSRSDGQLLLKERFEPAVERSIRVLVYRLVTCHRLSKSGWRLALWSSIAPPAAPILGNQPNAAAPIIAAAPLTTGLTVRKSLHRQVQRHSARICAT